MKNSIFYDPQGNSITIAVEDIKDILVNKEGDGTVLITVENTGALEFFWPDDTLWKAVE